MPTRDAEAAGMPAIKEDTDVRLLQVPVEPEFNSRIISYVEEGDEQVCYLLYDETRELLHLPPHIFELLARHCEPTAAAHWSDASSGPSHLAQAARGGRAEAKSSSTLTASLSTDELLAARPPQPQALPLGHSQQE